MNKFFKCLRSFHFWGVVIMFLICVLLHYSQQIPVVGKLRLGSLLGLTRHAMDRILFLAPITYAAFIFGGKTGMVGLVIALACMLPRVFFISPYPRDALFEIYSVAAVGILVNGWLECRRREIGRREQSLLKLEAARRQLQSYLQDIQDNEKRLREYADKISQAHEEERRRIARELHDDTVQSMVAISRHLDTFISENSSMPPEMLKTLEAIHKDIDESLVRMRRFVQDLRPPTLDHLGLIPALRELATEVHDQSGIKVSLRTTGEDKRFPPEDGLLIYRIVQEALRNVWKHSGADEVEISVEYHEDKVIISIMDNGKGFEYKGSSELLDRGKLGIMGMKERAHLLHGSVNVISQPDHGTTVTLEIPWRQ